MSGHQGTHDLVVVGSGPTAPLLASRPAGCCCICWTDAHGHEIQLPEHLECVDSDGSQPSVIEMWKGCIIEHTLDNLRNSCMTIGARDQRCLNGIQLQLPVESVDRLVFEAASKSQRWCVIAGTIG